ncbi:hypothetical protein M378DRAFT_637423 [Amanita muscaria Koide BX008]|uniref:Uncharacterized protein n=1 Tax=Amanita muscaria (strain Koide BX008) TaxID=946122 RepID=A0A0C2X5Z9_AMAMK|nr:hypothetical protein M378DRAFT_637423 [Amanita muscaria Koide BX008]
MTLLLRRAALLNMPLNALTIPHILARKRDTDITMRITQFYAALDEEDHKDSQNKENASSGKPSSGKQSKRTKRKYIGPTHLRALTIAQRELIVRDGLGDREPSV